MGEPSPQTKDVLLEEEMKTSYLTFAMSVIMSRALPDIRDGLKPSQRRVLIAMNDLNLGPRSKTRKCGKIVGDTIGNYHPHGDLAVYMTLVRMAQSWSYRYPLVNGQGNFGSVDGDPPAAMRYTEARMTAIATEMLDDITHDTVDFIPNYDETRKEPVVLPGRFPNLLCNGSSGIAVGMATNIPPHNLNEVCDAIIKVLDCPDVSIDELMKIMPGPDYPTGALICGRSGIRKAYRTGRGTIVIRARTHVETMESGKKCIIFTQIPYGNSPDRIVKRIADLVKNDRIHGIADLRNESDQRGMRIVVELKRGEDENVVLNLLYKHTTLQDSQGVQMIALHQGRPQTMNIREFLVAYRGHRVQVVRRRTQYLLDQAEARAHILEGLLIALENIDEIIETIKKSRDREQAKTRLLSKFSLSERQAEAILQMRLQNLTGLERSKIEKEYKDLKKRIRDYRAILSDDGLVLDIIREDLYELKEKYGDERRTQIIDDVGDFNLEDLVADETVTVVISHEGYIKRHPASSYRAQNRGGKGITAADTKEGDYLEHLFVSSTLDYILVFTDQGRVHWLRVYDVPQMGRTARGRALVNVLQLKRGERVTNLIPVRDFGEGFLFMATERGVVKKTLLSAFKRPLKGGIIAINLKKRDRLIGVQLCQSGDHAVLATREGQAIRFETEGVRAMGRPAAGVRGIRLRKGDAVAGLVIGGAKDTLLTVCEHGFGKRTALGEYRLTSRGGLGVINIKATSRNGKVLGALGVRDGDEVMIISSQGMMIRVPVASIRAIGRNTQGVKLINLDAKDRVVSLSGVQEQEPAGNDKAKEDGGDDK